MTLEELQNLFDQMGSVTGAGTGIGVRDAEAARIARALEYGSIAGQKPWPHPGARTVLAINPETGAQMVVSAQAPQGFIRAQTIEFLDGLRLTLSQPADWLDAPETQTHLERAVRAAAEAVLERIRAAVPRNSGRLGESLQVVA